MRASAIFKSRALLRTYLHSFIFESALLLPAHRLALILFIQPLLQRSEVIEYGGGVHLALAGERLQRVRPRTARSLATIPAPAVYRSAAMASSFTN